MAKNEQDTTYTFMESLTYAPEYFIKYINSSEITFPFLNGTFFVRFCIKKIPIVTYIDKHKAYVRNAGHGRTTKIHFTNNGHCLCEEDNSFGFAFDQFKWS